MAFRDLRDYDARLEKIGQLKRITVPVSQDLEITEITDRVVKGPSDRNVALLFENVRGHSIPVVINLFGTEERMAFGDRHLIHFYELPAVTMLVPVDPRARYHRHWMKGWLWLGGLAIAACGKQG